MNREYQPTSLEVIVEGLLKELKVDFTPQFSTRTGFVIDFAIHQPRKVAIEVDGEHWHTDKKAAKRDRFKDYQLRREGWRVLRIKELEVNNPVTLRGILTQELEVK